jgi:hypothetical protein
VLLGCRDDRADMAPPPAALTAPAPSTADFDAYARGTSAAIRLLRRTLGAGGSITWRPVDSVAAQATGMSIERFHALSATVESWLRNGGALTADMQRLDSLRIELMVWRVRVESQP